MSSEPTPSNTTGQDDCCPRCNSDLFGFDGIIELWDCYKCGFHEAEAEHDSRLQSGATVPPKEEG